MAGGERVREPRRDRAALARALRRYGEAPLVDRLFIRARAFLSDFTFIEPFVPRKGFVVDVGCGHGLFANLLCEASESRRVLGVDADPRKVGVAKLTEREGLRFELGDAIATPPPPCDSITILDLLYLLPADVQEELIASCSRALPEGRTMVVCAQEARTDPRYLIGYAQELVATSVGVTHHPFGGFHYRSREDMVAALARHGFVTDVVPLPRRPYTDAVYVARRVPH
ncbi:MAG: class I SAM-dependent methyltransferase [Chloroflexi bacterium]|nr:MAG: class I SAM-dependent methyltransferase [Chloroflexota bacterium]